jgi:hypothetical protein
VEAGGEHGSRRGRQQEEAGGLLWYCCATGGGAARQPADRGGHRCHFSTLPATALAPAAGRRQGIAHAAQLGRAHTPGSLQGSSSAVSFCATSATLASSSGCSAGCWLPSPPRSSRSNTREGTLPIRPPRRPEPVLPPPKERGPGMPPSSASGTTLTARTMGICRRLASARAPAACVWVVPRCRFYCILRRRRTTRARSVKGRRCQRRLGPCQNTFSRVFGAG